MSFTHDTAPLTVTPYRRSVIVGAGPVGLLAAIALKQRYPSLAVTMLEKHSHYQRDHVLRLSPQALAQYLTLVGDDPDLRSLLHRVKLNPHLRISALERCLKIKALADGVTIETGVGVNNVETDVINRFPDVDLIIGADGTHSIVSKELFGASNIVKHPFDYVMQLRFNIEGDARPLGMVHLLKLMQSAGMICHEYVGERDAEGLTPVTFQVMIDSENFVALSPHATSKNPLVPFANSGAGSCEKIPPSLLTILKSYCGLRLSKHTQPIHLATATVSVNEAPATVAQHIITQRDKRTVCLVGDAALGLSYFIGLNSGIDNLCKLLPALYTGPTEQRQTQLINYQHWFSHFFAPSKVSQVARFSFLKIGLIQRLMKGINYALGPRFFIQPEKAAQCINLPQAQFENPPIEVDNFSARHHHTLWQQTIKHGKENIRSYSSLNDLIDDSLLLFKGIWQCMLGALQLCLGLSSLLLCTLRLPLATKAEDREALKENAFWSFRTITESGCRFLLGLIQLIHSALLPLRMLIRGGVSFSETNVNKLPSH